MYARSMLSDWLQWEALRLDTRECMCYTPSFTHSPIQECKYMTELLITGLVLLVVILVVLASLLDGKTYDHGCVYYTPEATFIERLLL